jgi:hypothetical protein
MKANSAGTRFLTMGAGSVFISLLSMGFSFQHRTSLQQENETGATHFVA